MNAKIKTKLRIMTIGHGTRTLDDLIAILKEYEVSRVVDIRKMPRSATNPQFNYETLPGELEAAGISYTHMAGLTGLRKRSKNAAPTAWRNKSFQAFAQYMQTPAFSESVEALMTMAESEVPVLMCAETLPWRCHRSLVADALIARGVVVQDIFSAGKATPHVLPMFAEVVGRAVTYPPEAEDPK